MLEKLLGIKINRISYPEEQKTIDITVDGRAVRLDVYVNDDESTIYNVEIQTTKQKELPKRSRYYQGMIDLNMIEKGEPFQKLNESYVIFICTFDLFGKGLHRYTFRNICEEDSSISLDDEAVRIFFNTKGTADDVSEEVKAYLNYIEGTGSNDDFVKRLKTEVAKIKANQEWRAEFMTLLMRDQENVEKGRIEGRTEGRSEEKRSIIRNMLEKKMSDEDICTLVECGQSLIDEVKKAMRLSGEKSM